MTTDLAVAPDVALVILAMAAVTYLTRSAGFWIMGAIPPSRRVRRVLEALPGAVVAATVTPLLVKGGTAAAVALVVVVAAMLTVRKEFVAVVLALAAAAAWRYAGL